MFDALELNHPKCLKVKISNSSNSNPSLALEVCVSYIGHVRGGLIKHPNGIHMIYSLGSTVVINDPKKKDSQEFLQGHTNVVSCISVSKCGKYIASGQTTHMGFQVRTNNKRQILSSGTLLIVSFCADFRFIK
jgi:WD40 repeat protein